MPLSQENIDLALQRGFSNAQEIDEKSVKLWPLMGEKYRGFAQRNFIKLRYLVEGIELEDEEEEEVLTDERSQLAITKMNLFSLEIENIINKKRKDLEKRIIDLKTTIKKIETLKKGVQDENVTKEIEELEELRKENTSKINKIIEERAKVFSNSIINELNKLSDNKKSKDLTRWENLLQEHAREKYRDCAYANNYQELKMFAEVFFSACFYSSFEEDMEPKSAASKIDSLQMIMAAADLKACTDGSIASLRNIYKNFIQKNSIYVDFAEKTTLDLTKYCYAGSVSHLPSWLELIASRKKQDDKFALTPSKDMPMCVIKRSVEDFTVNSAQAVISFLCDQIVKTIENTIKSVEDDAKNQNFDPNDRTSQEWQDSFEYRLTLNLGGEGKSILNLLTNEEKPIFCQTVQDKIFAGENLDQIKQFFFDTYTTNPELDANEIAKLNLVAMLDSYKARDIAVPVWLQDSAIAVFLGEEINWDLLYTDVAYCKEIANKLSQQIESEMKLLSKRLKSNMPFLKIDDNYFQRPTINDETDLQLMLNSGFCLSEIRKYEKPPQENETLNLSGLLFHPEQQEIFDEIYPIVINYLQEIRKAAQMADFNMVNLLVKSLDKSQLDLSGTDSPSNLEYENFYFLHLCLPFIEASDATKNGLMKIILNSPSKYNDLDCLQLHRLIFSSQNKAQCLQLLENYIGANNLTRILKNKHICSNLFKSFESDTNNELSDFLTALFLKVDEESKENMALINEYAGAGLEKKKDKTALHFFYRSAQFGRPYSQFKVGEAFFQGEAAAILNVDNDENYETALKYLLASQRKITCKNVKYLAQIYEELYKKGKINRDFSHYEDMSLLYDQYLIFCQEEKQKLVNAKASKEKIAEISKEINDTRLSAINNFKNYAQFLSMYSGTVQETCEQYYNAAQLGDGFSQFYVGKAILEGIYTKKAQNKEEAVNLVISSAKNGFKGENLSYIADLYRDGRYIKQSFIKALDFYEKELDIVDNLLAKQSLLNPKLSQRRDEIDKKIFETERLIKQAAEQILQDAETARDKRSSKGLYKIALQFFGSNENVDRDDDLGDFTIQEALKFGHFKQQEEILNAIAEHFIAGIEIPKNYILAIKYYQQLQKLYETAIAESKNVPDIQELKFRSREVNAKIANVYKMIGQEHELKQNYDEAIKFYLESSKHGNGSSAYNAALLMLKLGQDESEIVKLLIESYKLGFKCKNTKMLAEFYNNGEFLPRNLNKSIRLYEEYCYYLVRLPQISQEENEKIATEISKIKQIIKTIEEERQEKLNELEAQASEALESNDGQKQFELGKIYQFGNEFVDKNSEKARDFAYQLFAASYDNGYRGENMIYIAQAIEEKNDIDSALSFYEEALEYYLKEGDEEKIKELERKIDELKEEQEAGTNPTEAFPLQGNEREREI